MAETPKPKGKYEISIDGGATWLRLFNITNYDMSGGDREVEETETLDEGTDVSVGPPKPKDISIGINSSVGSAGWDAAFESYSKEKQAMLRVRTEVQEIFSNVTAGATLRIAATGIVTAVQLDLTTDKKFKVGRAIVIAGKGYLIESITDATHAVVFPKPAEAVAATADWKLVRRGIEYKAEIEVLNAGNLSASPGSAFTESLILKQLGDPVKPTLLIA